MTNVTDLPDAPPTGHPCAELEAAALEACRWPEKHGELLTGRCGWCGSCAAHAKTMQRLPFMRWLVESGRLTDDTPEEGSV